MIIINLPPELIESKKNPKPFSLRLMRKFMRFQNELISINYYVVFIEFPTLRDALIGKRLIDTFNKKFVFLSIGVTFIASHFHQELMAAIRKESIPDYLVEASSRGYMVYTKDYRAFVIFLDMLTRVQLKFLIKETIYPDSKAADLFLMFSQNNWEQLFTSYTLKTAAVVAINNLHVGTILPMLMYLKGK